MPVIYIIISLLFGAALCYFILWVRSNFVSIVNRMGEIAEMLGERGGGRKTDVRGDEADTDEGDVRGQIGFNPDGDKQ